MPCNSQFTAYCCTESIGFVCLMLRSPKVFTGVASADREYSFAAMAHLGKRRADVRELDDFGTPANKRPHVSSTFSEHPSSAAVADQSLTPSMLPGGFNPGQPGAVNAPPSSATLSTAGESHAAVGFVAPGPAAAPVQSECKDIVLYQPRQQPPGHAFASSVLQQQLQQLQQQHQAASPQPLQAHQQEEPQQLGTAQNDHAALKSVWRSLTPAQRRSLAGMWDIIKTEELLPRLMPSSGLLALPTGNATPNKQQQQQQQHCIIEEVDSEDGQQQQQQQAPVVGAAVVPRNGFTAAAEAPGGDDMMAVDQQQPDGVVRQPSVEDMEM